jgi:two-component system phosphate regulon sensor histidine kinase PhoR
MKFIQLHKQALKTSLLIIIVLIAILSTTYYFIGFTTNILSILLLFLIIFFVVYIIFKKSVEQFIYKQLKKVYDTSLFEDEAYLEKDEFEADFESFIKGIKKFVDKKHQEIEKLHNRDDYRREFLGDVSHELKTPIFTAQGYLLTILDGSIDNKKIQKKYLERANKSIERLNFIVKDLDMISKLESGMKLNYF